MPLVSWRNAEPISVTELTAAARLCRLLLGWSLDAFDYFILVFCVSAVAADFHVVAAEVAQALFLTLAFRPVGAFVFGMLADRFGRQQASV